MYANTTQAQNLVDRMQAYGVQAEGEVVGSEYHDGVSYDDETTLAGLVAAGGRISRVRILTGNWGGIKMADISYIHGVLPSGKIVPVRVDVATDTLWGKNGVKARFIEWAKEQGVFAKGCGLLDESNWAVLHGA